MGIIKDFFNSVKQIDNVYEVYAKANDISYLRLAILYSVFLGENVTQKNIADDWIFPKQTINNEIKVLVSEDIVKLNYIENNKKIKIINFTDNGINKYEEMLKRLFEIERIGFRSIGEEKLKFLVDDLNYIKDSMLNQI